MYMRSLCQSLINQNLILILSNNYSSSEFELRFMQKKKNELCTYSVGLNFWQIFTKDRNIRDLPTTLLNLIFDKFLDHES